MKELMKKVLTVTMASIMVLSMLTACGAPKAEEPEAEAPVVEVEEQEAEAPAEEEAEAPASSGEVVKWAVSEYIVDWAQDVANQFTAQTGKEVEVIEVSGEDGDSKFMMMMQSAETAPDLIQQDGFLVNLVQVVDYLLT